MTVLMTGKFVLTILANQNFELAAGASVDVEFKKKGKCSSEIYQSYYDAPAKWYSATNYGIRLFLVDKP